MPYYRDVFSADLQLFLLLYQIFPLTCKLLQDYLLVMDFLDYVIMLLAGILYLLSVPVGYFENNNISIRDLLLSLILIGLAFAYKIQQKI